MPDNDRARGPIRIHGSLVRDLRRKNGFRTQGQLAEAVGCSRSAVGMWETSRAVPTPEHLSRLTAVLGVEVHRLLKGSGGSALRSLRLSCGLLQEDMAAALGLRGKGSYSDVERGRQAVPARWIPILANVFGQPESTVRESLGLSAPRRVAH
ncbi:helix-turn-helix transcriptional regulator [Streptomyces sp. NPDC004266]|uniref:helix-turn-helix transcriptional regulator n=1 Tax=Streptomyces sp. NPDC004266 TaxID=3364693 RepID=UPI00367AC31A